jgi:hypothetical protein
MTTAEKLTTVAENMEKVYEAGRQAEYDAFWDTFQQNGKKTAYAVSFGSGWTDEIFKPKYDIVPTDSYMMFRSTNITDLRNLPVKLDFSKSINMQYMFQWANTKYIGVIDTRNASRQLHQMFAYSRFISIDKLIIAEDSSHSSLSDMFTEATQLMDLTIEGCIWVNFNIRWSTRLTRDSITSVVNALSGTTSGLTVTFSKTAVNTAFTTNEWDALVATKPNWSFSLV